MKARVLRLKAYTVVKLSRLPPSNIFMAFVADKRRKLVSLSSAVVILSKSTSALGRLRYE